MDFEPIRIVNVSDVTGTHTELEVKEEPQSELCDNFSTELIPCVMTSHSSFQSIKDEDFVSEEEIAEISSKKKRKKQRTSKPEKRNPSLRNRRSELTVLPCIVNIQPSSILRRPGQEKHNGTLDSLNGSTHTSLQSSNSESDSNDHVANDSLGQICSNNDFSSKVCGILLDIQSTLKDLKAEVAENSKKIDQLQKSLPQPCSWKVENNVFNFPIQTDEQLLEFEKKLEQEEVSTKLFAHLTSRTYSTFREMIRLGLKYMLSRNVAMLYNVNGIKGSKKKFRDLHICKILVESVRYKFNEATTSQILQRISFVLAGARDWNGRPKKE